MKAILTVVAKDDIGIIAYICTHLAKYNINVMDISQTIMQEYFTMIMLVDLSKCPLDFSDLRQSLVELGQARNLDIRIQREDTFNAMHRL